MAGEIRVIPVEGIPEVQSGDDLPALLLQACVGTSALESGDVLVVTQKIVSKAEGRVVRLEDIVASPLAITLSEGTHRDPRHTEAVLQESARIVRNDRGTIISETRHGFICANAGVDASNVPGGSGTVALLPVDSDESARLIRQRIAEAQGADVAVIISDTFGRPWREGATNVAIGVAGMHAMADYRGTSDAYGELLYTTMIAIADELACTAELVTGKTLGVPAAIVRGYSYPPGDSGAKALVRPSARDLFR